MTRPAVASDARALYATAAETGTSALPPTTRPTVQVAATGAGNESEPPRSLMLMRAQNEAVRKVSLARGGAARDGAGRGSLVKKAAKTPSETPPETPPQTPPPYVRAGSEALNPRTLDPPVRPAFW